MCIYKARTTLKNQAKTKKKKNYTKKVACHAVAIWAVGLMNKVPPMKKQNKKVYFGIRFLKYYKITNRSFL